MEQSDPRRSSNFYQWENGRLVPVEDDPRPLMTEDKAARHSVADIILGWIKGNSEPALVTNDALLRELRGRK